MRLALCTPTLALLIALFGPLTPASLAKANAVCALLNDGHSRHLSGGGLRALRAQCRTMPTFSSITPQALFPLPSAPAGANLQINNRATDPYPLITQNEVSLAIWGNTIVVGFNDDWYGPPPFSFMGWSISFDGGRRWRLIPLPTAAIAEIFTSAM